MNSQPYFDLLIKPLMIAAAIFVLCCSRVSSETGVTLNLKDADIRSLIETVADATERNFVVDPRVGAKVTVVSARPMDREEIYQVFLSVLQVHGYAAVQVGGIIKILPDVNAKQGPVTTDEGNLTSGDELITRVVAIKNVPAAQMVPILRPLVPQQGHLAAYPNSNVLVISDRAGNIQRLISIINHIDRPNSQEIEVVPLQHASAVEVVRIITSMNAKDTQGKVPGSITLAADERSNSVLLSGDNAARLRIRGIIAHLDTPLQDGGGSQVVFLKYAKAAELAPILLGVSQFEAKEDQQGGGTATAGRSSDVDIQADETNNALIITASPAKFDSLKRIISQLDVRRAQVLVEAIIAEVSNDLAKDLGFEFAYIPTDRSSGTTPAFGALINSSINIPGVLAGGENSASTISAVTSGAFIGAAKLSGKDHFAAILRALETDSATNILSTPQLVTLDNEEAEIVIAENVPFITGQYTNTGSDNGSVTNPFQTIEREDVGITLRITPQINEGDSVKLDVEQESSEVLEQGIAGASDLVTRKRSIKTSVLAADQQTIVMGGLVQDTFTDVVQKIPLLGDIPLLGKLFRSTSTTKDKTNLMLFIHPVILRDTATSTYATSAKYSYFRAEQIESEITDRGLIRDGTQLLPDLDEFVTQLPGGGTITPTIPVSVEQLLEEQSSTTERPGTENILLPTDSDIIILE